MTDERQPPKLADEAPGLVWRTRKNGWAATWQARSDIVKRGYMPKTVALWTGDEPNADEAMHIAVRCQQYQSEMLAWSKGLEPISPNAFNGSLRSLINAYQTDADSPYQKNRYFVRQNRDSLLRRIAKTYGHEPLTEIKARVLLAWHKDWTLDGQRLATGSAFIAQLRALFSFGATLLEDLECERLCGVMHKMRFPGPKPRNVSITAADAIAIRAKAHEFGWGSLAMGQAFQFDCTLRQKDVVGEIVPLSEPGISDVIKGRKKWLRGIRWEEIDDNLILRHITSKKQKLTTVDLKLADMVLSELQAYCEGQPVVTVNETTKAVTVHRSLLPASGPVILCEQTAFPWSHNEYRRKWRILARACGIPDHKLNMGSRHGAIEEAIQAGAPIEFVRHAATHSDVSQTANYDRSQAESTAKVMKMRMESRNKPKTE
jgi:hypothetical protein